MTVRIETAVTSAHYEAGKEIFKAYAKFLCLDLEFQGFTEELASLREMYGPPRGCILLANEDEHYIGAVGLRELEPGVAEMKRMFVLHEYQGKGVGKALTESFVAKAKELGYRSIKLDSIRSLGNALKLYRKFGFVEIGPYRYNPYAEAIYMEYKID